MPYDYDKRSVLKTAADARHTSYEEALAKIQTTFVGEVGQGVYEYITTLHQRIGNRDPWEGITGFKSWDYGSAHPVGKRGYLIRVYQKDSGTYPRGIDPTIEINVGFVGLVVDVGAAARGISLFAKKESLDVTPSSLALRIGGAWEKLLTGSVDYGD